MVKDNWTLIPGSPDWSYKGKEVRHDTCKMKAIKEVVTPMVEGICKGCHYPIPLKR